MAVLLLTVSACSRSLIFDVETEIPLPLTEQIPATLGIYYPEDFRTYSYQENSDDRPNWAIGIGASQTALFDWLLSHMFKTTVQIQEFDQPDSGIDGIISPELVKFQFAMPDETKIDVYEAWVKYQMKLFDRNGALLADWPITGYGKTAAEFHSNDEEGLNFAINLALRDVGAKLVLGFRSIQGVPTWLAASASECQTEIVNC